MSSSYSQSLDVTTHRRRYPAIDPKTTLSGSATDKVVFLSGASRGIGQATAVAFAESGARALYLTARSEDALEETRDLVAKANPDTARTIAACDVTVPSAVEAAVADCVAKYGDLDVADANAGILRPFAKFGDSDPDGWWQSWEVNIRGTYNVARFAMAHLIASAAKCASKGRSSGHLIIVSSVGAQLKFPGASDYQTSKHAINRLVEFIQSDHGEDGIKTFAIHPGGVATDLGKTLPEAMHAYLNDEPDLAACFKVWLASGQADWAAGRYLSATWDVGEVTAMQEKILAEDLLVNRLRGA